MSRRCGEGVTDHNSRNSFKFKLVDDAINLIQDFFSFFPFFCCGGHKIGTSSCVNQGRPENIITFSLDVLGKRMTRVVCVCVCVNSWQCTSLTPELAELTCHGVAINQSISQSNFYSANIPGWGKTYWLSAFFNLYFFTHFIKAIDNEATDVSFLRNNYHHFWVACQMAYTFEVYLHVTSPTNQELLIIVGILQSMHPAMYIVYMVFSINQSINKSNFCSANIPG